MVLRSDFSIWSLFCYLFCNICLCSWCNTRTSKNYSLWTGKIAYVLRFWTSFRQAFKCTDNFFSQTTSNSQWKNKTRILVYLKVRAIFLWANLILECKSCLVWCAVEETVEAVFGTRIYCCKQRVVYFTFFVWMFYLNFYWSIFWITLLGSGGGGEVTSFFCNGRITTLMSL